MGAFFGGGGVCVCVCVCIGGVGGVGGTCQVCITLSNGGLPFYIDHFTNKLSVGLCQPKSIIFP